MSEERSLQEVRESIERLELEVRERELKSAKTLHESAIESYIDYVDPRLAYWDAQDQTFWVPISDQDDTRKDGGDATTARNDEELGRYRRLARIICATSEVAIGVLEQITNYVVGQGVTYKVLGEKAEQAEEVEKYLDRWRRTNRWRAREEETIRRAERDGEQLLRFFSGPADAKVRVVEPGQVAKPSNGREQDSFGIRTDPDDVEEVIGYWVDGVLIEPEEILHLKLNVDSNVKRGCSSFHPVRKNCERSDKLLRNMGLVSQIQTAVAMVRKHSRKPKAAVTKFADDQADFTLTDQGTGKTQRFQTWTGGRVLDAYEGMEYDFPSQGLNAASYLEVYKAEHRAVGIRFCMPEFMVSSDASNANYSSTLVSEGPVVRFLTRRQATYCDYWAACMRKVAELGIRSGALKVPIEALDEIEITVTGPTMVVRDRLKDVQADEAELRNETISQRQICARNGRDYEETQDDLDEHRERSGGPAPALPLPPSPPGE